MRRNGKGALRKMLQFMQFSCSSIIRFSEPQNFHCENFTFDFSQVVGVELPISLSFNAAVTLN